MFRSKRHASRSKRQWNNRLIMGVLACMLILSMPTLIKQYLLTEPPQFDLDGTTSISHVLLPHHPVSALHINQKSLQYEQGQWVIKPSSNRALSAFAVKQAWQQLQGTVVDPHVVDKLSASLHDPITVEVFYNDRVEPQRITVYKLPSFWLLNNGQGKWLAITSLDKVLLLD